MSEKLPAAADTRRRRDAGLKTAYLKCGLIFVGIAPGRFSAGFGIMQKG
jgi:hypothetical protein